MSIVIEKKKLKFAHWFSFIFRKQATYSAKHNCPPWQLHDKFLNKTFLLFLATFRFTENDLWLSDDCKYETDWFLRMRNRQAHAGIEKHRGKVLGLMGEEVMSDSVTERLRPKPQLTPHKPCGGGWLYSFPKHQAPHLPGGWYYLVHSSVSMDSHYPLLFLPPSPSPSF